MNKPTVRRLLLKNEAGTENFVRNLALKIFVKSPTSEVAAQIIEQLKCDSALESTDYLELQAWCSTFALLAWITATMDVHHRGNQK